MRAVLPLAAVLLLAGCGGPPAPEKPATPPADTAMPGMAAPPLPADATPAMRAYAAAAVRMNHAMMAVDRDPDVAFAKGMIPHHQGAIDMARIELEHGKDPAMRKLAEAVIAAQEQEIAGMTAWLKARGAEPAPMPGGPH